MIQHKEDLKKIQSQIEDINEDHLGSYVLAYPDRIIVYNYEDDVIILRRDVQQQAQLPQDFFIKLFAHPELRGYETKSPTGGRLSEESVQQLAEINPELADSALPGDFILNFPDKTFIYNYEKDILKAEYSIPSEP